MLSALAVIIRHLVIGVLVQQRRGGHKSTSLGLTQLLFSSAHFLLDTVPGNEPLFDWRLVAEDGVVQGRHFLTPFNEDALQNLAAPHHYFRLVTVGPTTRGRPIVILGKAVVEVPLNLLTILQALDDIEIVRVVYETTLVLLLLSRRLH